ncbi:MAG: gliding motility-associated peptidyl-prolyl isomerase GldI [Flavobacteriaceae bacterium]
MNKLLVLGFIILTFSNCKSPEARRPISVSSGSFIDVSVERNKKLNEKEESLIERIISRDTINEYIASENGFWYYYNTKIENDSIATPSFGDIVSFDYSTKQLNGSIIYTKEDNKTHNYAMDQQELFTGLREGLKLMKAGETVTFLFPSQKAFGYYGDNNKIGTNVPLMCEVTVNSITENQ